MRRRSSEPFHELLSPLDELPGWVTRIRLKGMIDESAKIEAGKIARSMTSICDKPEMTDSLRRVYRDRVLWLESVLALAPKADQARAAELIEFARQADAAFGFIPHLLSHTVAILGVVGLPQTTALAIGELCAAVAPLAPDLSWFPLNRIATTLFHTSDTLQFLDCEVIAQLLQKLNAGSADPDGSLAKLVPLLETEQTRRCE